ARKSPAVGWVTTIPSTITPEPTGTSAVAAIGVAATAAGTGELEGESGWAAAVLAAEPASCCPYPAHAETPKATPVRPAEMRNCCRLSPALLSVMLIPWGRGSR